MQIEHYYTIRNKKIGRLALENYKFMKIYIIQNLIFILVQLIWPQTRDYIVI